MYVWMYMCMYTYMNMYACMFLCVYMFEHFCALPLSVSLSSSLALSPSRRPAAAGRPATAHNKCLSLKRLQELSMAMRKQTAQDKLQAIFSRMPVNSIGCRLHQQKAPCVIQKAELSL